jgi:hypothetical protein
LFLFRPVNCCHCGGFGLPFSSFIIQNSYFSLSPLSFADRRDRNRLCAGLDRLAYGQTHLFFSQALIAAQVASSTELKCQNPMAGRFNSSTVSSCALVLSASLA